MKKILLPAIFLLLLSACSRPVTLTYSVEFTTDNRERMADLTLALQRVIERRLTRLQGSLLDYDVDYDAETEETRIAIEVDNAEAGKALNEEMTAPFDFEVRYLAPDEQEGDIVVEETGSFRATSVTKKDIDWVIGSTEDEVRRTGRVTIGFTDEGVEKMQKIFTEQNGNTIGLFLRGRLTASMSTESVEFSRIIEIPGLPSDALARIFADDMNVGIHMLFRPVLP